jgi:hypothetical protein
VTQFYQQLTNSQKDQGDYMHTLVQLSTLDLAQVRATLEDKSKSWSTWF